jgi:hypothetical protein
MTSVDFLAAPNEASPSAVVAASVSPRCIYNGDGGVDAAHEGGRSRFKPLGVADVSVKVPCMRTLGELAINLVNEALDFGHRSKPPVVFRLFVANVEAVTQADSHAVSR